jgi:hypothetical protein
MAITAMELVAEDFDNDLLEQILLGCEARQCEYIHIPIFQGAKEKEQAGDLKTHAILSLFSAAASLKLKLDVPQQPFAPWAKYSDFRSAILDDFGEEELAFFKAVLPEITDAEMQARIGDILWLRKRDYAAVEVAIEAYLRSAILLEDPKSWPACIDRIERGLQLAKTTGNEPAFNKLISHIENTLAKYDVQDSGYLSIKLLELLQQNKQGDPLKYAELAQRGAEQAEAKQDWIRARQYWQIQARWYSRAGDSKNEQQALLQAAETYVEEGKKAANLVLPEETEPTSHSYIVAAYYIQSAIEAYRRIKGTEERRQELHKLLLEYQEKSVGEMSQISSKPIDLPPEWVNQSRNGVKGKQLFDALFHLALSTQSPKLEELRESVEEIARVALLSSILSSVTSNELGKTIARTPAKFSDKKEDAEIAVLAEMFNTAILQRSLSVAAVIEPIRYEINLEHNVRITDFLTLVSNNPFVPASREVIYARGLYAGLSGDFLEATHLLVPQIENSIRYILRKKGVPTSRLDKYGIQNELDLNTTLYMSELGEILDEDTIFDLKGLLVEQVGSNIRNKMAHGLMNDSSFSSTETEYLWWLVLRLCCIPIIINLKQIQAANQEEQG